MLLVDDSIVRGTTSQRDRADGARGGRAQGLFRLGERRRCAIPTSTASTCRTSASSSRTGRTEAEIAREIGADLLIYQDLEALKRAVRGANPELVDFEASCFDGNYITGDITADYLSQLAADRTEKRGEDEVAEAQRLELVSGS